LQEKVQQSVLAHRNIETEELDQKCNDIATFLIENVDEKEFARMITDLASEDIEVRKTAIIRPVAKVFFYS